MTGVTVAVLVIGLIAAGAGTMLFLRNALDANLNAQVQQLAGTDVAKSVFTITTTGGDVRFDPNRTSPIMYSDYFVAVYAADGTQLATTGPDDENRPVFPVRVTAQEANIRGTAPFALDGTADVSFRASVSPFQLAGRSQFYTQLIALPTSSVNRIVGTFLGIYSILALITVLIGAFVTRWLVTLAFRSLTQVESTAMSIAAGDFSQRMTDIEPERTEVGRLKTAINAMLGRVDAALGQRDAAVRQMRRFVGDASHELRTPLVTVRGYAELYRMGAIRSDEDTAQAMDRIEKEAIRMGALVEDLLALTRLDERHEDVPVVPVDLRPIARDAAMDIGASAPRRTVSVTDTTASTGAVAPRRAAPRHAPDAGAGENPHRPSTGHLRTVSPRSLLRRRPRPAPEADTYAIDLRDLPKPRVIEPVVLADDNRVRQVVANLLTNARRYTPEDSPIDLIVGVDADAGMGWIAVADHGDGIPPQIRDQIFQRFWRADTSRTRETGGSGLGLSIVASIVQTFHGAVAVEETPGGGATFRVSLPLAPPSPETAAQAPTPSD